MARQQHVADEALRDDIDLPPGLATGIGSLPHLDPDDAVELVLRHHPRLPWMPTLPARSERESMLGQAADGVAGVTVLDDGSLSVRHDALDPEAPLADPGFSSDAFGGLRALLSALDGCDGLLKVQLTGPVTFGIALTFAGVPQDLAFRVAGGAVRARIQALLALLEARLPAARPLVALDEPGLHGLHEDGYPLGVETALDLVSGALAQMDHRAVAGVHCCGIADWSLVLATGPQVLFAPVGVGLVSSAGSVAAFLDRGGWIAWGAVPTHAPIGEAPDLLWRRLGAEWCQLVQAGCDPIRLRTQAIMTPACGLATHGPTQAEQVLALTNELARRAAQQAVGVQLSPGA